MSFNPRHFLRMARWARRPPSEKRVLLVVGVIAVALAIWGLEQLFGAPGWMQLEPLPGARLGR